MFHIVAMTDDSMHHSLCNWVALLCTLRSHQYRSDCCCYERFRFAPCLSYSRQRL